MTRVAVVAVHGVADQKPAESARAIADLINPTCGPFEETPIRIERKPAVANPAPTEPGMQYMHDQLAGYKGDPAGSVYETVRLEGARKADNVPVHVYEVYWADLSRAGSTSIRLFGELYQILLHFPSLGRNAIKAAMESATKGKALWGLTYFLQRNAVWFFTVTIPLLNLALLSLCLVALSSKVPDGTENYVAAAMIVVALAVSAILGLRNRPLHRFVWWVLPFVCVGAGAAFWWWAHKNITRGPKALMVEAALIGCVICIRITMAYTKMKNRAALAFGIVAALATSGISVWHSVTQVELPTDGYRSALYTANLVGVPLRIAWIIALVLAIVAALAGLVAALASDDRKEGLRVAWTARFSLAFPMAMFAVVTLALWLLITRFLGWAIDRPGFGDDMHELLLKNAGGFVVFASALTLFILAAIWVAAPSVTYEIKNPEDKEERSEAVGRWVTNGLYFIGGAGDLLTVGLTVTLLLPLFMKSDERATEVVLYCVAAVISALFTMKFLLSPFRSAIDAMLDVDNYMRESPEEQTPRARIAERFVSLLRHLCAQGYDRIVIVSHSQGTVIAADTLRFVKVVSDPELQAMRNGNVRVGLFTMGCPLKQLYAVAFPHFYRWIEQPVGSQLGAPATLYSDGPPKPEDLLGVDHWANAYRSGDYVGRHLWTPADAKARLWVRGTSYRDNPPARTQFCAGAGAHTHYWDKSGADIATQIEQLM